MLRKLICILWQIAALYYMKLLHFWGEELFEIKFKFEWKKKMSSEISFFSKISWHNPAKVSFMYQQLIATVDIFLKVPTTYFKNSYFDTKISNYLQK